MPEGTPESLAAWRNFMPSIAIRVTFLARIAGFRLHTAPPHDVGHHPAGADEHERRRLGA
jgi:hypothetical protein